jgi:hypothetical protein
MLRGDHFGWHKVSGDSGRASLAFRGRSAGRAAWRYGCRIAYARLSARNHRRVSGSSFFFLSFRLIVCFGPLCLMTMQPHRASRTSTEELFENLPMGLPVRELGGQLEIESGGMGTAVFAVFPLQRAQTGDEDEEHNPRIAGKRLETRDLRIDNRAIGTNGTGEARREGVEFRAARARRRGASRRST